MPVEGAIAERTRGVIPVTWDALSRDTQRFGDGLLLGAVLVAQEGVFGRTLTIEEQDDLPLRVIDYAAKLAALELIPPGIDFWMNQPVSESATGVNENHTFVDRAEALRRLRETLLTDSRKIAPEMSALINSLTGFRRYSRSAPLLSSMDDELLTPSPQDFPRPFAARAGR